MNSVFRPERRRGAPERLEASSPILIVVLSDINMPVMDGLTLLNRLPEVSPLVQTVMVSAYGDMENIRTAMNRGAYDFVCKPVNFDDLERTIEKTMHGM
jgi:adenylate cyclase